MYKLQFKESDVSTVERDLKSIGYNISYKVSFKDSSITPTKEDLNRFSHIEQMLASGNIDSSRFDTIFPGLVATAVATPSKKEDSLDSLLRSAGVYPFKDKAETLNKDRHLKERPVKMMRIYTYGK